MAQALPAPSHPFNEHRRPLSIMVHLEWRPKAATDDTIPKTPPVECIKCHRPSARENLALRISAISHERGVIVNFSLGLCLKKSAGYRGNKRRSGASENMTFLDPVNPLFDVNIFPPSLTVLEL